MNEFAWGFLGFFELFYIKDVCTRTCIRKQVNDTRIPMTQPWIVRSIRCAMVGGYLFDFRGRPVMTVMVRRGSRREETASECYINQVELKITGRVDPYWILYWCIAIQKRRSKRTRVLFAAIPVCVPVLLFWHNNQI